VLIVDDPDAPSGVFRHWAPFNILPSVPGLTADYGPNRPAVGLARNDFGAPDDGGPCLPKEHGVHHYHFRLFAISRPTLDPSASAFDVLQAAQSNVIQQTELIGTYQR
jgi:Raf kinase inhibitor-like YbhB/YbcL family protein